MFWDIFYDLCLSNGTKPNSVCKKLELSNATATHWKNGTVPNGDALIKIADYFDCSVDYLLGRTDSSSINSCKQVEEKKESPRQNIKMGNLYNSKVNNASGDSITINNEASSSEAKSKESQYGDDYSEIIEYLNGLNKKDRLHALVDIKCLLEDDYGVKKNYK